MPKQFFNRLSCKQQGYLAIMVGILLFVISEFGKDYLGTLNFLQRLLIIIIFDFPGILFISWGWKSIKK
ncbi:MAG TPA: hypothetical protein VLG50_02060 [Candidatus Saccharimonadales bacterium]|nr:hypothetical protein [Candidatus Saccharimonadales bacterium]